MCQHQDALGCRGLGSGPVTCHSVTDVICDFEKSKTQSNSLLPSYQVPLSMFQIQCQK